MRARGSSILLLALLGASAAGAPAQAPSLTAERSSLLAAKQAAAEAETRAAALNQAAEEAGNEAERARARAQALQLQVKAAEADIAAGNARLALIAGLQQRERARIADKQGPILRLVAALQTMARRPPALAITQPGSIDDIVHVRLLLADALPVIQARTATLRADLDRQTQLAQDGQRALAALDASHKLLDRRQKALAVVEATALRRSQRLADQAAAEQERALALGEDARDIADRLQTLTDAGEVRERLEKLDGPAPRPAGPADGVPVHDGDARYRLPVTGDLAGGFGEVSPSGVTARGVTLAAAPGAKVVAPAAGTIAFAGPFRSYGRIVIIAHGNGWTTTVTGLAALAVKAGQRVAQGGKIGEAGPDKPQVTTELRRDNRPVDIVAMAMAG
jgi:murein hydrolase activator